MASYDYVTGGQVTASDCPAGYISSDTNVQEWVEPDSNRVIFASRNDFRMVPGYRRDACNGEWINWNTERLLHGWGVSDLPDPEVSKDRPSGGKDGSVTTTLSISTADAGISWEYSQPNVSRDSVGDVDNSEWNYAFDGDWAATHDVHTFETGSECEFQEGATVSSGDTLNIVYVSHEFADYWTNSRNTLTAQEYYYYK